MAAWGDREFVASRPPDFRTLDLTAKSGIGGWLVLPLLGLVLTVFSAGKGFLSETLPSLRAEAWSQLTSPDSPVYSNFWAPYIVISGLFNLVLVGSAITLLVFFFRRRRAVPFLISLFYAFGVVTASFEALSVRYLSNELPGLMEPEEVRIAYLGIVRSVVVALVWVSYFRVSTRVRATFVES